LFVRQLRNCPQFISGDQAVLRELLHADKGDFAFGYSLAHATLPSGKSTTPHKLKTSEVYYILEGAGKMYIDGENRRVAPGCAVYIPPRSVQYIKNIGKKALKFLCIVDPAWRKKDETVFHSAGRREDVKT